MTSFTLTKSRPNFIKTIFIMIYTKNLFQYPFNLLIFFEEYVLKSINYFKNNTSIFNSSDKSVTDVLMNS